MAETTPDGSSDNQTGTQSSLNINFEQPGVGPENTPIEQYLGQQATSPTFAPGTQQVAIPLAEQPDEILTEGTGEVTPQAERTHTDARIGQIEDQDVNDMLNFLPASYNAETMDGAEGVVDSDSLVRTQLASLMTDVDTGNAAWADAAIRKANALMAKRGLGASSMAGAAISQAVIEAALPIAQMDAATFGTMNLQNLKNRQAALVSNQAAQNAAKQFNAKTETEVDQFMAAMRDKVLEFNVNQSNSMERFNSEQTDAIGMFYDKMANETDKFNSQNALVIAKSNAEWRRTINTANTAAENVAMQQNVQNMFNMSQQAVANLWQQARDAFHWANVTSQNSKDRAFKLALFSMQREHMIEDVEAVQRDDFYDQLGDMAVNVIGNVADTVIGSLFSDLSGETS